VSWIRRLIFFHRKRHPKEMGSSEIEQFLSWLAVRRRVSASTQNHALSASLFLYRRVRQTDLGTLPTVVRARTPERLPVVLDVVLLDVTAWPSVAPASAGDSPTQVILRDRHGKIITRRPDLDDLSPLYKLVAHSARQAKERDKPAGD